MNTNNFERIKFRIHKIFQRKKKLIFIVGSALIVIIVTTMTMWMMANRSNDLLDVNTQRTGNDSYSNVNREGADINGGALKDYDFKEAAKHIGERARVSGKVLKAFTAKSGVTFFDFCKDFNSCPFSAVIFASDSAKFGDLKKYERQVKISGVIKSYNGRAEMVISDPSQIE